MTNDEGTTRPSSSDRSDSSEHGDSGDIAAILGRRGLMLGAGAAALVAGTLRLSRFTRRGTGTGRARHNVACPTNVCRPTRTR